MITESQLGLLQDIFFNTEALDKITIAIAGNDINIEYEDIDEEWMNELKALGCKTAPRHSFFYAAICVDPATDTTTQYHGTLCFNQYDPSTCVQKAVEELAIIFKCAPKDFALTAFNALPDS